MFCVFLFCSIALVTNQAEAADACTQQISFEGITGHQRLAKMITEVSKLLNTSVVAEIEDGSEVDVPGNSINIDTLLSSVDPDLHCSFINNVIHISAGRVLKENGNLLNHKFSYFEIPADVDHFLRMLRTRLDDEGFDITEKHKLIKPSSGYIPADASSYPLKTEELHGITARDLILRVASQQVITCVFEFAREDSTRQPESVWKFAEQHWQWTHSGS
jgi:hypothetical protein